MAHGSLCALFDEISQLIKPALELQSWCATCSGVPGCCAGEHAETVCNSGLLHHSNWRRICWNRNGQCWWFSWGQAIWQSMTGQTLFCKNGNWMSLANVFCFFSGPLVITWSCWPRFPHSWLPGGTLPSMSGAFRWAKPSSFGNFDIFDSGPRQLLYWLLAFRRACFGSL